MNMDQDLIRLAFDGLLGLANIGIVFVLTTMRTALTELRAEDRRIADKVNTMEVLVASHYLTRAEFSSAMKSQTDTILRAIDQQQKQIDGKQDRGH